MQASVGVHKRPISPGGSVPAFTTAAQRYACGDLYIVILGTALASRLEATDMSRHLRLSLVSLS